MDKVIMGHSFDMHNAMGRFFDERIYHEELMNRCGDSHIEAHREVEILVSHLDFHKKYYLDLLVERGAIYELKTAESLSHSHQNQLINYLLLTDINHGKLVNFRAGSVESRFVSTRLNKNDRMTFKIDEANWKAHSEACVKLKCILQALLQDWGAFLEMSLYREALTHLLGGHNSDMQVVNIEVNGRIVGSQKLNLLNPETAWHLSAARVNMQSYETHIARLLRHTRLNRIHWINLNQRSISLKTLIK
ncbi:MAG: GxxExxY protein [Verrucomicrobiota bacterium]